jgi:hypothetical protein
MCGHPSRLAALAPQDEAVSFSLETFVIGETRYAILIDSFPQIEPFGLCFEAAQ